MVCPKCGNVNANDSSRCTVCNTPLSGEIARRNGHPEVTTEPRTVRHRHHRRVSSNELKKKKKDKKKILILAILCAVLIIAALIFSLNQGFIGGEKETAYNIETSGKFVF